MMGLASYLVFFACVVLVLCILTMGLNLQWGFTGLFNAGVWPASMRLGATPMPF